jgi:putative transposase
MTLAELEAWLVWQIAGVYHFQIHSAIRCTPLAAWKKGIERMPKPIREPSDPQRFYLDFLPFEQRFVTREGIRLFNVLYWHGALGPYICDGDKHMVRYDPSDLSHVYLLERGGSYHEIPYRDISHGAVSLREIQTGARHLRASGTSPKDEQKLFQAIQKQRAIIANSNKKTLKARRQAQQTKETNRRLAPSTQPEREVPSEPELSADPFPFEIWHE